jgi:hypothetical protein
MNVFLEAISGTETITLLQERGRASFRHQLVTKPEEADIILMLGNPARQPGKLLDNHCYKNFPDRCAVYTEEDSYLPLIPGVYCSAQIGKSTSLGRVFSYSYVTRNGRHVNPFLPETILRHGGKLEEHPKKYLFSFQGGSTSFVRKRLFAQDFLQSDILITNTAQFLNWDNSQHDRVERQQQYARTILASHFVLCPRGAGSGSIRFFEVMASGIAPVLIADDYPLPIGVAWDSFLLRCPEREISRLPDLLVKHLPTAKRRGEIARSVFEEHFADHLEFDRIVELAMRSLGHEAPSEAWFRKRHLSMIRRFELREKARSLVRAGVKNTLNAFGVRIV